jgi:RimJ/RimL family protein N-acetyltransferase
MGQIHNEFGQPIGPPLSGWVPPPAPPREPIDGRYCRLEPLDADLHAEGLYEAYAATPDARGWTYLQYGPFPDPTAYRVWVETASASGDPLFFAVIDKAAGLPAGVVSYLRITPPAGSIEVGHIHYAPPLRRSPAATEAMFLLMRRAFDLGYRRYEWKCDALNAASRAAAVRLGLSFEGVFRQATVYKGRSRDTAWYAAIDADWPLLRTAFEAWLDPRNFGADGRQRLRLSDLTEPVLKHPGEGFGLRPATNADGEAVRRIVFAVLAEFGFTPDPGGTDADLADLEASYFRPGGTFDVLTTPAGEVVGTVGLFPLGDGRCELRKMYLAAGCRGRGLGKRLLRHTLLRARQLGFRRVELETSGALRVAIRLYESFGFRPFVPDHMSAGPERADRAYYLDLG